MKQILFLIAMLSFSVAIAQNSSIPHLETRNGSVQLTVNNQHFLLPSGLLGPVRIFSLD